MITVEAVLEGERALLENNARPLSNGFYVASASASAVEPLLAEMRGLRFTSLDKLPTVKPEDIGLDPRCFRVRVVAVISRTIVCVVESLLN